MSARVNDFPAPDGPNSTDIPDSTVNATSSSNSPISASDRKLERGGHARLRPSSPTPVIAMTAIKTRIRTGSCPARVW